MADSSPYSTYTALSFDIFGTLLDWETGFYPYLQPLIKQLPSSHSCAAPFPTTAQSSDTLAPKHPIFEAFDRHEGKIEAEIPKLAHEKVLEYAYRDLATELGVSVDEEVLKGARGSAGAWPAFEDTREALRRLSRGKEEGGRGLKLVALSNVSEEGMRAVLSGPLADIPFAAAYTAETIGSYKPALDNFEYLLSHLKSDHGIEKHQLLHVAHGIGSDQLTPEAIGLDHVWVERGTDNGTDLLKGMKRCRRVRDMRQLAEEMCRGGK